MDIWQSLLLAQGQLSQNFGHLTASSAFASRIAALVTGINLHANTPEGQCRYLVVIAKLWSTLKNTFTAPSLSSPAERILASLLETQFSLTDPQVKDLWSQLCADLVAVGIPTLLHILHRRSSNREGTEVTRQLWMVLAKNESFGDGEDWMHLVHFLAMPFGFVILCLCQDLLS